jgi:hypothetical protein
LCKEKGSFIVPLEICSFVVVLLLLLLLLFFFSYLFIYFFYAMFAQIVFTDCGDIMLFCAIRDSTE